MHDNEEKTAAETENATLETQTKPQKPIALTVKPEGIPDELKRHRHWVLWRYKQDEKEQKWKKVPYRLDGCKASPTNPSEWSSFDAVIRAYETGYYDGIGFCVTSDLRLVFVDIDHAKNESGEWSSEAQKERDAFNSYCELSPSGAGFRIICHGSLSELKGHKNGDKEIYDDKRYLTITGHRIESYPATIEERQEAVDNYVQNHIAKTPPQTQTVARESTSDDLPVTEVDMSDDEVLEHLMTNKSAEDNKTLWEGGNVLVDKSDSENDLSLCARIVFYTQKQEQIDRLFQRSGRMREKWNEIHDSEGNTYGEITIRTALRTRTAVYRPKTLNTQAERNSTIMEKKKLNSNITKDNELQGNSRWNFTTLNELRGRQRAKWLIKDVLVVGTTAVAAGETESFKTFNTLDMALCIVTGKPWHGHEVQQGSVVYISAEGGWTLRDRLEAWESYYELQGNDDFYLLEESVKMGQESTAQELANYLQPIKPKLVVIDTLSACFAGLNNENANDDMATFERHMKIIAKATGACVLAIHHHSAMGKIRGGTALPANVDTHLTYNLKDKTNCKVILTCTKHRSKKFDPIPLRGKEIPLAEPDEYGGPVTSLVFELSDEQQNQHTDPNQVSEKDLKVLKAFASVEAENNSYASGISAGQWKAKIEELKLYKGNRIYGIIKALAPEDGSGLIIRKGNLYMRKEPITPSTPMYEGELDYGEEDFSDSSDVDAEGVERMKAMTANYFKAQNSGWAGQ